MRPSDSIPVQHPTHAISDLDIDTFDVICIGSGWAGRIAAARIVKAGYSAVIIENELIGGDCPFWACVPSKVLLRSQEALQGAQSVGGASQRITDSGNGVDPIATFHRRDVFVAGWDDRKVLIPMVERSGVHIVRGFGKLAGLKKVAVTASEGSSVILNARLAVLICTGSSPIVPSDVVGLKEADPWTPRDATSSSVVPDHLIIMGAGAVGTEMATAYRSLGSHVTLISSTTEILPSVDDTAGKLVRESLQARGVDVKVGTRVCKVTRGPDDGVTVTLSNGQALVGSELLLAAGRQGNTEHLGLEAVGVNNEHGFLNVDDTLCVQTDAGYPWLYAAGDVNGRNLLTHTSKYHARIASNAIIQRATGIDASEMPWSATAATADHAAMPQVIFSDPQVAQVGLTRKAAESKGVTIREVTTPMTSVGYMIHADGAPPGWAQWLIDDDGRLVGATFVGIEVAEVLHAATVAVVGGMKVERLVHAIPSFPTVSEVFLSLADAAGL